MSHSASTPSAFKRIFVGDDAGFAGQVPEDDILHVAGRYGTILRVGSNTTEDYVIWTGTANTSFGELDIGANLANYLTVRGAATGSPPTINAVGVDTNIGIGLLPKGEYAVTTDKLFVMPESLWAAAQTSNASRPRTQFSVAASSFVNLTGVEFYPQFSVSAGAQTGVVDVGARHGYNVLSVDEDNIVTVAGGAGPEGLAMLYLGLGVGKASGAAGGAHGGGRNALDANIAINSDVDVGPGTIFHTAVAGNVTAYRRMGGIVGSARGNVFGSLLAARGQNLGGTGPGARYLTSIVGAEIDVEQQANVSAQWKMGLQIVEEKDSATNAEQQNVGLLIANQPSATTIGWGQAISVGGYNGQNPVASNGQVLATLPTPIGVSSFSAADGVNLSRFAFSRASLEMPSFYVDGSGNVGGQTVGGKALQTVSAINAKVSSVSSVTVVEGGSFDGGNPAPFPTFTLASPLASGGIAGTTATMIVTNMGAVGFTGISTGGNGLYVAGETLTALGGTGTAFTVYIETVTAGVPTNIRIASAGNYTVLPTNPVSFTGSAAGTGFTLGMRWTILTVAAGGSGGTNAGTNYNELRPPTVDYVGLMTQNKEARFKVNMAAGTMAALSLNSIQQNVSGALSPFIKSDQVLVGNVSSSSNVYVNNFNLADAGNTTTGSGPGALNYFTIIDALTSSATGGRNALFSTVALNGAMTNSSQELFYNAASFDANASYNQGGSASIGYAKLVGMTSESSARAGATYINAVEASEIGAGVRPGASAYNVNVFRISPLGYAGSRGGFRAYNGLVFAHGTSGATNGEGLDTAIGFGATDGNLFPVARAGSLLEILTPTGAPTNTVAWGVDFGRGTFDGGAWRSPGTTIDGTGKIGGTTVYGNALQTASTIKAATAVVGSIAVTNGGAFEAIPTLTIAASPGGGTTATATVASMKAARAFIDTQGSGYTNGDVLTLSGGTFGTSAQVTLTVAGGLITEITVSRAGSYTVLPSNAVSTTGGTGTGAKFFMQWGINAVTVTGAGTLYNTFPPPFISCSGEKSIKALFAVTMTETQQPLLLNAGSSVQVDSLTVLAGGITFRSGTGAASGTQPKGSVWMRTDGGVGTTMYVSQGGGTWNAVAGV